MSSVSFVSKHEHSVCVSDLNDPPDIRADAVIGGVVHQHGFCVGVFFNCFFNVLDTHSKRYAEAFVSSGVYINGHSSANHQRIYRTAVNVSWHDYLFTCFAGGENHRLHSGGRSVYYKKGVLSAESLCRKLLSVFDDACGVTEVVKVFH